MAGGYQGPEQGYVQRYLPQQTAHNDVFANFLYRIVFGPTSRPGDRAPQAMAESFNPTKRAGLINDLSMFFGGGHPFEAEMPGQFEPYSMAKSPVRMQEGQPHDIHALIQRANFRASQPAAKMVHDLVFGGEVHAKGPIPSARLNFGKIREQAVTEREKTSNELDSMGAKRYAEERMLRNHGIQSRPNPRSQEILNQRVRSSFHGDRRVGPGTGMLAEHAHSERQAILARLYSQIAHNHRN